MLIGMVMRVDMVMSMDILLLVLIYLCGRIGIITIQSITLYRIMCWFLLRTINLS